MCLNRSSAHAGAVVRGLLMDGSASGWDPRLSCLCTDLLLLHTCEVSFEEEDFKAQAVLMMSEPFLTHTFYLLLMPCILLRANAVHILDPALLFFFSEFSSNLGCSRSVVIKQSFVVACFL